LRLQDYEPGKDMGMDWYMWRIIHLVDEVNRLTDLLSNTSGTGSETPLAFFDEVSSCWRMSHRKDSATASPSRTYGEIMEAQWEQRGLAEQAAADHARDALINETVVSD
jgi:hypothetical protein